MDDKEQSQEPEVDETAPEDVIASQGGLTLRPLIGRFNGQ